MEDEYGNWVEPEITQLPCGCVNYWWHNVLNPNGCGESCDYWEKDASECKEGHPSFATPWF